MDKKIVVKISPLGLPTVEAVGFEGQGCAAATAGIEKMLSGGKGMSREYKPEWTSSGGNEVQETVKQGW